MIETGFDARVKISQVIENQLPEFLLAESPKSAEFLKQYYISQEYQGGTVDIVENLDQYLKLDNFTAEVIKGTTTLTDDISSSSTTISVSTTKGFPDQYGLLKIDNEIITYTGISNNTFTGCIRGFSGITTYRKLNEPQSLEFSTSEASSHTKNSQVINLSALFLQEFYKKLKYTLTPGLENTAFVSDLDVSNFIKSAKSFYQAKGTPESFRILFNVLYGENPTVLDLESLLIKPSDANFSRREVVVAELLNSPADPLKLIGQTIRKSTDPNTQAAISEVEILNRKGKTYYKLSLFVGYNDIDLIQGQFNIQAQTKVLENVSIGASIISVDSTIGFGQTGTLISGLNYINYTNKSVNQFFGCSGITNLISSTDDIRSDEIVYGFENGDPSKKVDLRLTGVLSKFVPTSDIYYTNQNEIISIKNVGEVIKNPEADKTYKEIFANSWIYNTSSRYQVGNISGSTFTLLSTPDKSSLNIGDRVDVIIRGTQNIVVSNAIVTNINQLSKQVTLVNLGAFSPSPSLDYDIRRKLKKASSTGASLEFGNNNLISDVQNLYVDNEYAYVASNSLPNYAVTKNLTEVSIPEATGSPEQSDLGQGFLQGYSGSTLKYSQISFASNVPFISGDEIIYEAANPIPGLVSGETYYVQVLNPQNKIRLYVSRSFVGGSSFVEFETLSPGSGVHKFILSEEKSRIISPQKILRKFPLQPNLEKVSTDKTEPGYVGLLINGVEITSPKSNDKVYYGPLESIEIINSGKDYDVLNPPEVIISPPTSGTTSLANVVVRGSVNKVTVDPQEFDLDAVVSASISGGNGSGAILKPIVSKRYREIDFDARISLFGGGLDLSDETITFKTQHNFNDGEPVVYNANGNPWLGIGTFGPPDLINNEVQNKTLVNGSTYYAKVVNSSTIKLYQTFNDYFVGINTVGLTTENNGGIHKFRTLEKNTLRSIEVINFNNISKRVTSEVRSGVSTIAIDSLVGIKTGDLVVGNASLSISGVSTIISFDESNNVINIQDTTVGIITESTKLKISRPNINEYENRRLYVKPVGISTFDHTITFTNHNFNHGDLVKYDYTSTPISGLSTENNYYVLKLDDNTFRVADAGIGTDSKVNFERNNFVKFYSVGSGYHIFKYPDITLTVNVSYGGTVIQQLNAIPTISGKIVDVYLYENGSGYGSGDIINLKKTPKVSLKNGKNAELKPIVKNGRIIQVDVLTGGSEYVSTPNLIVQGDGTGADIRPIIQNQKIIDVVVINSGIGYIQETTSVRVVPAGSGASLQANIRELNVNKQFRFNKEILVANNNLEYSWVGYDYDLAASTFGEVSTNHSPLIGWAYDGNPIYGPYGFTSPEDNGSGIKLLKPGYTLDISKVADRPTIFSPGFFIEDYTFDGSGDLDQHNGRFCKTPEFPLGIYAYFVGVSTNTSTSKLDPIYPYFIGNTYRSPFIKENVTLDQSFDFNRSNLSRNTFPYKVADPYADNDFLVESNELINQVSIIEAVSSGSINSLSILEPGSNYKVGDLLNFDNSGTEGGGLSASVSSIVGKTIHSINTQLETYNNLVFEWKDQETVTATYQPYHQLLNNDSIIVSGLSSSISNLSKSHRIGVTTNRTTLFSDVPSNIVPRAVVDLYVSHIPQSVSIGSSIVIENEILEVLNVFPNDSILRVRRSDVGAAHTISTPVNILPNKFNIPVSLNYFDSQVNEKVFFNPKQSVGLGTTSGLSINLNYTIGSVTKEISVPIQSIYLPNHPFKTGQEVTLSKYSTSASFIVSNSSGGSTFNLPISGDSQNVYIINKSKDYIGLTTLVGLTTNTEGLFFTSDGDDNYEYNLQSNFAQVTGNVYKINSTIFVSEEHQLLNNDQISLKVSPNLSVGIGQSTKVRIKYEDNIQKLIVNTVGFDSSAINSTSDIITINSHNLKTGDKVFYNSLDTVASGLSTGNYFVYKIDDDKIKLAETPIDLQSTPPTVVNIIGVGGSRHEISLVNPQLLSIKNNDLAFDVSDSSLQNYNLKFYYDKEFTTEFIGIGNTSTFNITGIGTVGIGSTASVTLKYSEGIPTSLYYTLEKSGYISTSDTEVLNYSQILFVDSRYNGTYKVSGIGSTSFNISLNQVPEKLSYRPSECDQLEYKTTSRNSKGGIGDVNIIFGGYNYKKSPKLLNILSDEGTNANIIANATGIGSIQKIRILDQGFEYSADKTLRPEAYVSPFVEIINSNTITKVEVFDGGKNYSTPPSLIVKNPSKNIIVDTTQSLRANVYSGSISSVDIIAPIYGLGSVKHQIIPVNNSNGVGISSVIASSSGIVTCVLSTPILGFSTNIFVSGDQVLVEGIEKEGITGTGFNSEDYNYTYFPVVSYQNTNPAVIEYDVSSLTTNPGLAKTIQSAFASIINKKNLPQFEITQKFTIFDVGEQILTNVGSEFILRDLYITESTQDYIKVSGSYSLKEGDVLKGRNSAIIATINNIIENKGKFNVDYSVRREYGWTSETGKLSEIHQVSSDNDYYQNLSYTVKSSIQFKDLVDPVNRLLHTSGLKNFSDTQINSKPLVSFATTSTADDLIILDIRDEKRVDSINNYDFTIDINTYQEKSKYLKLKNKKLSDFVNCISNRVLVIDDVSTQFSSRGAGQNLYSDISPIEDTYYKYLVQVLDPNTFDMQIIELVVLSNDNDVFTLEKAILTNTEELIGDVSGVIDEFDTKALRFTPNNPFDIDYDIKILQSQFNSTLSGINTQSVGFINLTGVNTSVGIGTTSNLISIDKTKFTSLFANIQIINTANNTMNYVELFLDHDNTNTYLSEYYFDTNGGISTNFIGSFNSVVDGNDILLNFYNDEPNNVLVRSKIVGFGTTSVGIGTYRFIVSGQGEGTERTMFFESNYGESTSSIDVIGISTEITSTVKSLVRVSYGETSSLHQVLMLQDRRDIYTLQYPFLSIGSTSGIGTFGGEFSGSEAILRFYPDNSISEPVSLQSFNEVFYTESDYDNIPPDLEYGTVTESLTLGGYDSINGSRGNKTSFALNYQGTPIYAKTFNPSNSSQVDPSTGIFTIRNHFFSTGERLTYTPRSTFVGVSGTSIGIGSTLNSLGIVTDRLPQDVYAININSDQFRLSTRKDYAYAGIYVTFTDFGSGNAHQLEMSKKLEKSIISIDGVVQKPITYVPISYYLANNAGQIGAASTYFSISGISTLRPKDLLKIDEEFVNIISVGFGSTPIGPITGIGTYPLVETQRGFVGSSATSHSNYASVQLYRGSFNIVNSNIYFTDAPKGSGRIQNDRGNLPFPYSDFGGRTYLRNDYTYNLLFDDISDKFTGIGQTYGLSVQGINTSGIETGSGVLFINDVFQTPTTLNNAGNNYNVISTAGISSVVFTGITSTNGDIIISDFDVNQNQLPRGGIIVSLGSTPGLGFAPLVGASVTAIISGGVITSVGIGSTDIIGSGYRGVVSIGVTDSLHTGAAATITASVGAGGTLAFNVVYGGTGYVNPTIQVPQPSYENLEVIGISRRGIGNTTDTGKNLLITLDVGASSTTGIGSTLFEVSSFKISRPGYAFEIGDVFKPVGLVTDKNLSAPLSEFELTVLDVFTDSFSAWQFGELDYIDSIKNLQNGVRVRFPLLYNSQLLSFEKNADSLIDLNAVLLIFVNGVIQEPGIAYQFEGGTSFVFTEPPKVEDDISIFFYRGTRDSDSTLVNVNETLKIGDFVQVYKNDLLPETITQGIRRIDNIPASDTLETNIYVDLGIDETNFKPFTWTKQKVDRIINGDVVYKSRDSIEPQIYPTAKVIQDITSTSTNIFVDNAKFFNYEEDNYSVVINNFDALVVQSINPVSAGLTAVVSAAGTIQSLSITNAGSGYIGTSIDVKISAPKNIKVGVGSVATATATIVNGSLSSTTIINPGLGYTITSPPQVIVDNPPFEFEKVNDIINVEGFAGIITGITTSLGTDGHPLAIKFFANTSSFSGLQTGYPIYVFDTFVGTGLTSVDSNDTSVIGIGTEYVNNIYQVHSISVSGSNAEILSNISTSSNIVGINTFSTVLNPVGNFSWGRFYNFSRPNPVSIGVSGFTVDVGLSTFPVIQRRGVGLRDTGSIRKISNV
jgi:hypothetical protein